MKHMKTTFAFLVLALMGTGLSFNASAYEVVDHVTVIGMTPDQTVAVAKHKIAMIQTDPGYYYAGAWGAKHRVHDVKEQMMVIETAQRVPASVH